MKCCYKCKKQKDISEFHKDKSRGGWNNICKQCKLEYVTTYRKKHKKEISKYNKEWSETHKKKRLEYAKKYLIKRRKIDIKFCIKTGFSSVINSRLKKRLSSKKGKSTFSFLPYTIEELMAHLEKQFKPGMTWENRSAWHIDHIKADSKFNYKSVEDEEFQKCWALSNLQPLWAKENLEKSNKY